MERTEVVIGVVERNGLILIGRRKAGKPFAGYWEFPGGKREPRETREACLVRELREEVGIDVQPLAALPPIEHDYPAARIRLHPYLCAYAGGQPTPLECDRIEWVHPRRLSEYTFPPANEALIANVITHFESHAIPAEGRSTADASRLPD